MTTKVVISKKAQKLLEKLPRHIALKLLAWVSRVEKVGLENVRMVPGYHDEPLTGALAGLRSIRLSLGYRAYYRIRRDAVDFVFVEGADKHAYKG